MSKEFIERFKIEKALGPLIPVLEKGSKLNMFGCVYTITNSDDKVTLLLDEAGTRLALPSHKLQLLLKCGYIRKAGILEKSQMGVMRQNALPVGTVKPDPKGGFRKKVSMQPSRWVHLTHGTSHTDHASPAQHPAVNSKERAQYKRVIEKIKQVPKEKRGEIISSFKDYIKNAKAFENLQTATSMHDVDEKGNKVRFTNTEVSQGAKQIQQYKAKAGEARSKFITSLKQALKSGDK